jgi:DUF4097 and DUF4098 domain-containing protein YvlB
MNTRHRLLAPARVLAPVILAAATTMPAQAQTIEREFPAASGGRLTVDLETGGSIGVEGWDRKVVAITATKTGKDCDVVRLDLRPAANGVEARSEAVDDRDSILCDVELEIRVPKRFDLRLQTMGGEIRIAGVEGEARGQTMGGSLQLTGLQGTVDLETMGGSITLTDSQVDGRVHTMGGSVRIEDVVGNVRGTSMGGSVVYRNVTDPARNSRGGEIRLETMGGGIDLRDAPDGANVSTMGGSIRIGSAAGHVKARTMGGSIEIGAIDGWVEATTMGGSIDVRMVGDPAAGDRHVTLTSMGGDITLEVPDGLSMAFDITLAYTRDARREYRIISDFPMEQRRTDDWDTSQRQPKKYIYGSGSVAGGKHRIRIETVNGDIRVKRASSGASASATGTIPPADR